MASATSIKISRILHAGYIFDHNQTRIIFDPIFESPFSGNCYSFPPVRFDTKIIQELSFAAIFISHYHDDHCSFESLTLLDRSTPIYIHCIYEELFELIGELGFKNINQLKFDEGVRVGDFVVTPRRPIDDHIDSILQIKVGNLNILNVVDSVLDSDTLEVLKSEGPWDLVLWPFQTMRETAVLSPSRASLSGAEIPSDWIEELQVLNPRIVVPSACQFSQEQWSWYNNTLLPITYRQFGEAISASLPESKVVRINPGCSFVLDQQSLEPAGRLEWVVPIGDQEVDYEFNPSASIPSTAEIAKKFVPLSSIERNRVFAFCENEILLRFRDLEPTPFFSKVRVWRLSLFDHTGVESIFCYSISQNSIELISTARSTAASSTAASSQVSWVTEVSIAKLFLALERGETLTSMYVRVNDVVFSHDVEKDLKQMDVLEDPLIRTLFDGRFGDYQREQLRRIKSSTVELA